MRVTSYPDPGDADSVVVRWGDAGRAHTVKADNDQAIMKAWKDAVAEGLSEGDLIEDEVDRSVAREVQERAGIRVAKADGGGLIVAYWPDEELASKLSALVAGVEGAVSLNDLHLTLLYLDTAEGLDVNEWDVELVAAVLKLFSTRWSPCEAAVTGLGRFVGPEAEDIIVALIDSPRLGNLRTALRDELCYNGRVPFAAKLFDDDHGFIPHVTLAYVPKESASPAPLPALIDFEVNNISLAKGPNRIEYDLYEYEREEMAEMPVYRARASLEKAGRVLSGANLAAVEEAIQALNEVAERERARGLTPELDEEETEKRAEFLKAVAGDESASGMEYLVTKSTEDRYTFGPLYAPERKDIHGEYVDADVLQKAVWEYVRASAGGGRRINLQHGDLGDITVAEWVEVVAWPEEHTITVKTVEGDERELTMPAGTVYVGALWDEDAWPLVKSGKLNGWSLGGRAVKVSGKSMDDLEPMGDTEKGYLARKRKTKKEATEVDAESSVFTLAARGLELERAAVREEAERTRSLLERTLDAFGRTAEKQAEQPMPEVHVHLPEQNVTINEDAGLGKLLSTDEE